MTNFFRYKNFIINTNNLLTVRLEQNDQDLYILNSKNFSITFQYNGGTCMKIDQMSRKEAWEMLDFIEDALKIQQSNISTTKPEINSVQTTETKNVEESKE